MSRRPPWTSSMIAMALLACGESVAHGASAAEFIKMQREAAEKREQIRQCAKEMNLSPDDAQRFIETGKLPEPSGTGVVVIKSGSTVPSEVIYQEYQDGKLTYEVTAPRADLVRAVGMRQAQCFMPLVAFPEAPRLPAKPRSKSGQRRAHARLGR